jgi:hypothetical protein
VKRFLIVVGLVGSLALPATAVARTERASADGVSAAFSYQGSFPHYRNERLRIASRGRVVYDRPVSSRHCTRRYPCGPLGAGTAVHVVRLGARAAPAVVLALYTGGAHCCVIGQVFFHKAGRGYVKAERDFGDPGFRLADLRHDGTDEFLSADDSFAYTFTDYAASALPVQVLSFTSSGRFANVTRSYPKLIAADAAGWMRAFRAQAPQYSDTTGVLAAWAADEDELGGSAQVASFLNEQARAGHINSSLYPKLRGRHFIAMLDRFLREHGYLR